MAGDGDRLVQEYQQMNKTAFVLGYTGEVGKDLVKALLSSHIFAKVVLIGRRTVTYEDELYKDVVSVYWMSNENVLYFVYVSVMFLSGCLDSVG